LRGINYYVRVPKNSSTTRKVLAAVLNNGTPAPNEHPCPTELNTAAVPGPNLTEIVIAAVDAGKYE